MAPALRAQCRTAKTILPGASFGPYRVERKMRNLPNEVSRRDQDEEAAENGKPGIIAVRSLDRIHDRRVAPCNFSRHASLSTDLSEIECRFDIDLEVVAAKMSGLGFAAAALWMLVENRLDGIGESRRRNRRQHGENGQVDPAAHVVPR
jgi:hypothetical protein